MVTSSMGLISIRSHLTKFNLLSLGFESTSTRVSTFLLHHYRSVYLEELRCVYNVRGGRTGQGAQPTAQKEYLTASNMVTEKNVGLYRIKYSRVSFYDRVTFSNIWL